MALKHDFFIKEPMEEIRDLSKCRYITDVSVDLILFMRDSLLWIETLHANNELKFGIDYYGLTTFDSRAIVKLQSICENWVALFKNAPTEFFLTGCLDLETFEHERVKFNKSVVIKQLQNLINLCDKALELDLPIIHWGI